MSEIDSSYSNEINNRIRAFETQYRLLSTSSEIYNRYNTWVHFECNDLVIDTANPVNKNIILQTWEYDKNGSGNANSFTLRICYDFANAAELYKDADIHYVEKALCLNKIFENSDGFVAGYMSNSDKLKCNFQYGYLDVGTNGERVLSSKYEGMVTSCVPELRDNMLFYTIKGKSGIFGGHDSIKFSFPKVTGWKCSDLAWEVLDMYYGSRYKDHEYRNSLKEPYVIVNKTNDGECGIYSKEKNQDFDEVTSATIFEYVNSVLEKVDLTDFVSEKSLENVPKDKRPRYVLHVDDIPDPISGKKRMVIDLVDPLNMIRNSALQHIKDKDEGWEGVMIPPNEEVNYDTKIVFTYPDKHQNFILSFLPSIDLNVIWSGVVVNDSNATRWGIDDGGILLKTESVESETGFITVTRSNAREQGEDAGAKEVTSSNGLQITTVDTGIDSTPVDKSLVETDEGNMSISSFSRATDISYKASMSCVGIPCDIPIGTRIKIQPILNGSEYMFSGCYYIISCSDRIDSNGFITDMNLFRISTRTTS